VLLDGVSVAKDVVAMDAGNGNFVFQRTQAAATSGTNTWRTVLVQSFGNPETAGYFALDITDPVLGANSGPRFLWQLTTDADGNPLFGRGGATPLITTVFLDTGNGEVEVPVAVLPGGQSDAPTGGQCTRGGTSFTTIDSAYQPRTSVNCYGSGVGGRSLTIVRLDTGEVIRTFRRQLTDAPASLSGRVIQADITSPITGQPVAFPGETGAVADRIFVGDRDGSLWRVDVSNTDSSKWTMDLFFDAYPASLNHAFDAGQPIATPPVLSVDELGNITVALSTGDQEALSATPGMKNYVWSLTERPGLSGAMETKVNWYKVFDDGERVAGPITLFDGQLFFSSFMPAGGSQACNTGNSTVWGMHYLLARDVPGEGGIGVLPTDQSDSEGQRIVLRNIIGTENTTVFGVGVAQQPTCNVADAAIDDPFLGFGQHTSLTRINPGKFQLVLQTGSAGTAVAGGKTNVHTIDLETPALTSIIDSWATILE
jgi:type IV pilus assembly protein PilY1